MYNEDVICVVVDGGVYCSEVVDVVDVVVIVMFVRVAESVVPCRTDHAFDGEQFLVLLLLFVVVSISCC